MSNYYGCIYKIENKLNGKIYIGQTIQLDPFKRINRHFKTVYYKSYINRAIRDNGSDAFVITILISCFNQEDLNYLESYFISYYNCLAPNGYNLKLGGLQGGKCSEIVKEKISGALIGKLAKGKAAKGQKKSLEHRLKMSLSRKGKPQTEARKRVHKEMIKKLMKKIQATNIKTGETLIFDSIELCAKSLNLIPSNISRVARGKQGRTQHKDWSFQFLDDKKQKPLPLKDKTYEGIRSFQNGFTLIFKGEYISFFKSKSEALKAKRLLLQGKSKQEVLLQFCNKIKIWKKRING